jgi:hypothetical protein
MACFCFVELSARIDSLFSQKKLQSLYSLFFGYVIAANPITFDNSLLELECLKYMFILIT